MKLPLALCDVLVAFHHERARGGSREPTCIIIPSFTVKVAAHAAAEKMNPPYAPLAPPVGRYAIEHVLKLSSSILSSLISSARGSTSPLVLKYGRGLGAMTNHPTAPLSVQESERALVDD